MSCSFDNVYVRFAPSSFEQPPHFISSPVPMSIELSNVIDRDDEDGNDLEDTNNNKDGNDLENASDDGDVSQAPVTIPHAGPLMRQKRKIVPRRCGTGLLSLDFEYASDSSPDVLAYPWTINTKYYNAVWMAHLHEDFSAGALPAFDQLVALVMVFDISNLSSFVAPTDWVSRNDIHKFENLLCIGNKVDLLPGHSAHIEGSNVLGDDDLSSEIKRSCLDWCIEHNIEYIEACAANADFYKCLSVDGDSQGVERLYGALSAFLWPGMILKSGDKINEPSLPDEQEQSDDSDYELEYETLSAGSADPWDDRDVAWVSADGQIGTTGREGSVGYDPADEGPSGKSEIRANGGELQPSSSASLLKGNVDREEMHRTDAAIGVSESDKGTAYDFEDLEQLMFEIGNIRGSLRLMPDFQRREMAANWQ